MFSIFTYDLDGQTIRAKCRAQSATECSHTTAIGTRLKRNFAFAPPCFHPKTPSPPARPAARRNLLCARDRAAARHPVCDSISAVFWAISMFDTSDKRRHNGFTCVCWCTCRTRRPDVPFNYRRARVTTQPHHGQGAPKKRSGCRLCVCACFVWRSRLNLNGAPAVKEDSKYVS